MILKTKHLGGYQIIKVARFFFSSGGYLTDTHTILYGHSGGTPHDISQLGDTGFRSVH